MIPINLIEAYFITASCNFHEIILFECFQTQFSLYYHTIALMIISELFYRMVYLQHKSWAAKGLDISSKNMRLCKKITYLKKFSNNDVFLQYYVRLYRKVNQKIIKADRDIYY